MALYLPCFHCGLQISLAYEPMMASDNELGGQVSTPRGDDVAGRG